MASSDDGRTWNTVSVTDQPLGGIAFSDARHGWAVGGTAILRTVDGGASFARSDINPELGFLDAVDFVTADLGVAVGSTPAEHPTSFFGDPLVLRSTDGGLTWQVVPVHAGDGGMLPRANLRDVCLTSGGLGIAVGGGFSGSVVLVTKDFGESWESAVDLLPGPASGQVSCSDDVITVAGPGIYRSTDGRTWQDRTPAGLESFSNVTAATFVDAQHGWAVGGQEDAPLVFHTDNGGRTWKAQSLPTDLRGNLFDIAAASSLTAIAVGLFQPHGIATTTGGATWTASTFPVEAVTVGDVDIAPAD